MTQHRTGLFWALFAAILAMLLCSVGVAEGSTDELSLDGVPESVTLYTDTASPHVSPSGTLRFKAAFKNSNSTISDLKVTLEPKGANDATIDDIAIDARPNGDKKVWWVYISYSPVSVGTSEYTLTAFTPDNEDCRISKDIAFTVAESDPDLPASIDVNPEYFGESNIYSREIVLKENESQVTLDSVHEFFPTYSINGQDKACTILTVEDSGFMYRGDSFIFSKTGKFTVKFATNEAGSNWELNTALIYNVTDGSESSEPEEAPTAPPVITGIPDEDTLVPITYWEGAPKFTLTVEQSPLEVFWNVSCDNPQIVLDHSELSGNELRLWACGNTKGAAGTIIVKAWYNGYDNMVTVESFKVHTEDKNTEALILDQAPDTVTLSMETRSEDDLTVYESPEMWLFVTYNDYSNVTDLEQPTFTLKSGNDVLKNISIESRFDTINGRWRIIIRYNAATTGTGVYSLYARVPNDGPSVSKDITFNVVDRIDDLPTKFNISPDYFDENNVYKTILEMPEDGSELVFNFSNEAHPTYTRGDKVYNADFDVIAPIDWHDGLIFKKAGRYPLALVARQSGSNWQLRDIVYFVVHSNIQPKNPTPTLTGVPEGDVLIGDDGANVTITATNLEQTVNWEVTCNNGEIEVSHWTDTYDDESNLKIELWANSAGISGTVKVKAWYDGHEDDAAVATFDVYVENRLILDGIPETITLYKGGNSGGAAVSDTATLEFICYFADDTYPENVDVTFTRKSEQGNLIKSYEFNNTYSYGIIKYATADIIDGTYELTATTPDGEYTVSRDIEFIVNSATEELPSYFEFDPKYFTADHVYCHDELVMPADGSPLEITFLWENHPKYTLNGEKRSCSIDVNGTGIMFGDYDVWIFPAAGTYEVKCFAAPNGSNWELADKAYFVVKPYVDPDPVDPWPPYTPVEDPTAEPTLEPTIEPTAEPTLAPTAEPTAEPTPTPAPIMEVTTGGRNLNVRLSPVNGDVVAKLPNGTRLEVLGTENGWSRVRATLPDGTTVEGYVMDVYLSDTEPTPVPATSTPDATLQPGATPTTAPTAGTPTAAPTAPASNVAKVTTDGSALRLRSGPNTRSDILVRMPNNAEVAVLETVDGWTRIRFTARDGKEYEGWASADFIKPAERPTTPPAPTSAPEPTTPPQPTATPKPNSPARVDAGGKRLNMRTQPGAGSDVVVKLPADAELIVIEYGEKWSLCSYGGIIGYCSNEFLSFR